MEFFDKFKNYTSIIEKALNEYFSDVDKDYITISNSSRYSLLAGGKRIRPVLCLATGDMLNNNSHNLLPYACAIEMIHTFSLIHDDLPCMDNDDYRRGRLTCHKVYGEGIAVLAGDALINKAYDIMISDCVSNATKGKILAIKTISTATGENGMIGGQVIDIESEHKSISYELLKKMHSMKTGALIKAPVQVACNICDASIEVYKILEKYATSLGLAFQIKDDILDVESDSVAMGKTIGKDQANEKSTFVTLFGINKAKELLNENTDISLSCLGKLKIMGYDTEFLEQLTNYLLERNN